MSNTKERTYSRCVLYYVNIDSYLEEQLSITKRSGYGFIISPDKPGSFLLVYRHPNNNNPRKDIITVTPTKYEFRGKKFDTIGKLLEYFKYDEMKKGKSEREHDRHVVREKRDDRHITDPRRHSQSRTGPSARNYQQYGRNY
jgi:hypothetical protein